jgi:ABC-type branched-subunit amino acid transport system ATPase component
MMLSVDKLAAGYGPAQVLFDVSFAVGAGEVVTLLGRNGMGKTTTIRTIMGLLPARGGSARFADEELLGRPPYRIAQRGLGLVPEGRQIFPTLSVEENLSRPRRRDMARPDGHSRASTSSSRAWPNVAPTWATSCPEASSRCSPSAAR